LGQGFLLFRAEGLEQGAFVVQVQRGDPVYNRPALAGQFDQHSAGVGGVRGAPDKPFALKPV
jgi:hypothetical protein